MAKFNLRVFQSIGGIVLIALVAAALIISVVVFVKNRGEQARHDEAVKIAEQQAQEEAQEQADNTKDEDTTDESTNEGTVSVDEEDDDAPVVATTGELPRTGSQDGLGQLLAVTALAISASLYVASRRARVLALES